MNNVSSPPMFSQQVLSSADALSGYLDGGSSQASFGPVGLVSGAAPPAFHQTKKLATFDDTYSVGATAASQSTLQIHATNLINSASSTGLGIDSIGTQASSEIGSANIVLTDNLSTTLSILGLSLSATLVHSDSDASYVFGPNRGFLGGDASFGSLTIGGSLIGKTLTFAGGAAANTILYHSSTVTITLDKQTLSDFLPPSTVAPIGPNRITTDAIDISLNNAHLGGQTLSGDIALGETSASLFPPLHA
jgi:hypothetical protein